MRASNLPVKASRWLIFVALVPLVQAQQLPKPGFNLFSKQQDIQLGKEAAAEIEKQVRLVTDPRVISYVEGIGKRLAQAPEADDYPYTFKVVYDETVNAFALPGGPTYVHTGLLLAVENEAQLAGVMAHEIAHVALRHGTSQASKANFLQLAALLASGVVGGGSLMGKLAQAGIGLGANSVLLKFSRSAERDADVLGAHIMARAGYDPLQMARFFEKLEAQTGNRSAIEQFFSSHPNPGNRRERIQKELAYLPRANYTIQGTGQLSQIQAIVRSLPKPAPGRGGTSAPQPASPPSTPATASRERQTKTEEPGAMLVYRGREFSFSYPASWHLAESSDGDTVTVAPDEGYVTLTDGSPAIAIGLIAGIARQYQAWGTGLEQQTQSLIQQLQQANPSLRPSGRPARRAQLAGQPALITTLYSDSPFAGQREIDMLVTVLHPAGLFYLVCAAPQARYAEYQQTFEAVVNSIRFR